MTKRETLLIQARTCFENGKIDAARTILLAGKKKTKERFGRFSEQYADDECLLGDIEIEMKKYSLALKRYVDFFTFRLFLGS